jgi:stage IV sporulation protein FB
MRWSLKVLRVAGIDVRMHFTFLLFLAWIGYAHYQEGGAPAAVQGVLFISLLFGCVLLHEFGHAIAARAFGIHTPDITLLPIGGVARLERMPDKPWQELVVAAAGPAVNVVIALVLLLGLGISGSLFDLGQMLHHPQVSVAVKLASFNIVMMLFNLLPAFPMDGGRVLRALLAMVTNYVRATQVATRLGQVMALGLGAWGLFSNNPLLIFIAFFVYLGAAQEAALVQMREIASAR